MFKRIEKISGKHLIGTAQQTALLAYARMLIDDNPNYLLLKYCCLRFGPKWWVSPTNKLLVSRENEELESAANRSACHAGQSFCGDSLKHACETNFCWIFKDGIHTAHVYLQEKSGKKKLCTASSSSVHRRHSCLVMPKCGLMWTLIICCSNIDALVLGADLSLIPKNYKTNNHQVSGMSELRYRMLAGHNLQQFADDPLNLAWQYNYVEITNSQAAAQDFDAFTFNPDRPLDHILTSHLCGPLVKNYVLLLWATVNF